MPGKEVGHDTEKPGCADGYFPVGAPRQRKGGGGLDSQGALLESSWKPRALRL